MKKKFTAFCVLLVFITVISYEMPVLGQTDAYVRIGLFYNNSTTSKAAQSSGIKSDSGMTIGSWINGQFLPLYDDMSQNTTIVRKDSYYTFSGTSWIEYQPAQGTQLPGGIAYGPWHVQLGGPFTDYQTALQQVAVFKQSGVPAFPAYMDTWYVWTGYYVDQIAAQTDINVNLRLLCPLAQLTIVPPSPTRIVLVSSAMETSMIFASSAGSLRIRAIPPSSGGPAVLRINNSRYRGDLEFRRLTTSDMTVSNILSVEEYLYGVVPCEIEASAHAEAVKAQAVAARTYAYSNMGKHASIGFDLVNTTSDQVYKGFDVENAASNKAVDDTSGQRVVYNGKPAAVFYFSSSGGWTEDSANVWGSNLPYLKSVVDKYESGKSYNYNWVTQYQAVKVKEALASRGTDIGDILAVEISKLSGAGRAIEVVVRGTTSSQVYTRSGCRSFLGNLNSQWYTITTDADVYLAGAATFPGEEGGSAEGSADGDDSEQSISQAQKVLLSDKKLINSAGICQLVTNGTVNGTVVTSARINVLGANGVKRQLPVVPSMYTFAGKGWGHAVGMSQEGAKGMAATGYTYDRILAHYFPGTQLQ